MKKLDQRIRHVLDQAVASKHRSIFMILGDEGKTEIVHLHQLLCNVRHQMNLSVLWCMKKEVCFGGASKSKRLARSRKEVAQGRITSETQESFEEFLKRTPTTYCKYEETSRILGNTYDMLILQDYEALSPNVLARTVETVRGGGLIVLMVRTMPSLEQLYHVTVEIHTRFRSETHPTVHPRFHRRFILSFEDCPAFLCCDDRLNVLPITDTIRNMYSQGTSTRRNSTEGSSGQKMDHAVRRSVGSIEGVGGGLLIEEERNLAILREQLASATRLGSSPASAVTSPRKESRIAFTVAKLAMTLDQAKVLLNMVKILSSGSLAHTVALTAARGRGKSAALGIAAAVAILHGFTHVVVTSPSPENLRTFFVFVASTLKAFELAERRDFSVMQSTSAEWKNVTLRIEVHRASAGSSDCVPHRQTICYVAPEDWAHMTHAELLIIDEAAAIPLPVVQRMLGSYLIFLSSTVNGYEGTGRSLALKLFASLRKSKDTPASSGRTFHEMTLHQPIRYGPNDPVEQWLYRVLCLEAKVAEPQLVPHPSQCQLFHVNRDVLFSYHPRAESMLQKVIALLVHAHYKNQPNDLQLLADAPAHEIFVLMNPSVPVCNDNDTPDILTVLQVCHEGSLDVRTVERRLGEGERPHGDLIPYTLSQSYLDASISSRCGLRIVRIATHPSMQRSGYGRRTLQLFTEYCRSLSQFSWETLERPMSAHTRDPPAKTDEVFECTTETSAAPSAGKLALLSSLHDQNGTPRIVLDLVSPPEYMGVSFGLTIDLMNFWRSASFLPVYLRQATHENTGEYTMIMLHGIQQHGKSEQGGKHRWIVQLSRAFHRRFIVLLNSTYRTLPIEVATMLSLHTIPSPQDQTTIESLVTVEETRVFDQDNPHTPLSGRVHVDDVPQLTAEDLFCSSPIRSNQLDPEDTRNNHYSSCPNAFTLEDLERLRWYSTLRVDYSVIADLVPFLGRLFFSKRLYRYPYAGMKLLREDENKKATTQENITEGSGASSLLGVELTAGQAAVLVAVALQGQHLTELSSARSQRNSITSNYPGNTAFSGVPLVQLRTFLHKSIVSIAHHLDDLTRYARQQEQSMKSSGPTRAISFRATAVNLNEETVEEYCVRDPKTGIVTRKLRSEMHVQHTTKKRKKQLVE